MMFVSSSKLINLSSQHKHCSLATSNLESTNGLY